MEPLLFQRIIVGGYYCGLFGIAAVTTMLALAGMVVALIYGPVMTMGVLLKCLIYQNARKTTDALDAVGNTTKL